MYNLNVNQVHVTLKDNHQARKKKDSKLCNPG